MSSYGEALDPARYYSVTGYWYLDLPGKINRSPALEIKVLKDKFGGIVDATAVVAYYLQTLPNHTVDPDLNRITLVNPLPERIGPNKEIQPLAGVPRPEYLFEKKQRVSALSTDGLKKTLNQGTGN